MQPPPVEDIRNIGRGFTMNTFRVEAFVMGDWLLLCEATTIEGANITAREWGERRGFVVQIVPNTEGAK
jgi:hypothetical protein